MINILYKVCIIISFSNSGKWAKKKRSEIVKCLSGGCSTLTIAKLLRCDLPRKMLCDEYSTGGKKPRRRKGASWLQKTKKNKTWENPLASTATMFQNCNLPRVSRNTRWQVLRDMATVRKAEIQPPLHKTYKLKHHDWAKKYLKTVPYRFHGPMK